MFRISQKIFLVFSILMIISAAAVLRGKSEIDLVRSMTLELVEKQREYADFHTNIFVNLAKHHAIIETMLSSLDLDSLAQKRETARADQDRIFTLIQELYEKDTELFKDVYTILIQKMARLSEKEDRLFVLMNNFAQMQATELFDEEIKPLQKDLDSAVEQASAIAERQFSMRKESIENELQRATLLMYISMVVLLMAYSIGGIVLWGGTIKPINSLTRYLKDTDIKKSAFNIPLLNRSDEIGDFSRSFAEMVAERDCAEASLRGKVKESEKANHAKSEFLANMSHELRTPLNSILGIIQLMRGESMNDDLKDMLNIVSTSSNNLLKIVNDILDLSKIEAGETALEYIAFDASKEIKMTANSLKPIASKKGLVLNLHNKIQGNLFVLGDPLRFTRIIINMVNNAISYTEQGSVTIEVDAIDIGAGRKEAYTKVIDTGIGIPEDRIEKIFEKFTQADTSTTRKFGGTGLGLTITRELVELMDGEIGVESEENIGSTFWFKIPFETVETFEDKDDEDIGRAEFDPNILRVCISEAKILMAEDQPMNIVFMEKLFKNVGINEYTIVENGEDAVSAVEHNSYDLILMDCHMPVMNGYQATKAIRSLDDPHKSNIPIMAMTANVMQKDIDECFAVGMDDHIGKPFNIEDFQKKISKWIDISPSDQEEEDVQTQAPPSDNIEEEASTSPVDLTNLRDNAMGDEEFVKEMVEMFASQGQSQISELKNHCTSGMNEEWVEIAHALKGTAGGVGAQAMRDLCAQAQDMEESSAEERSLIAKTIENQYDKAKDFFVDEGLL